MMKRVCSLIRVIKNGDSGIIFNGLTGAVLHASSKLLIAFELAGRYQSLAPEMLNKLFPNPKVRETLEYENLLVPVNFNENSFVEKARKIMVEQDIGTNVEFIVTYRCNFRCLYCYAGQSPPHMSKDTAQYAVNFARKMADERKSKAMKIQFIGGEPLLNTDAISIICEQMAEFRDDRKLIMRTSLTSNGSLLTREILRTIKNVGPIDIQLTLDGPEVIHNQRRPMINGNSFRTIINNIEKCIKDIDELAIRINVDYDNMDYIPQFLSELRKLVPETTSLSMVPTFSHTDSSAQYSGHCFKKEDLAPQLANIWDEALALGYPPSWNPYPTFMSCGAVMPGSIAIDPFGDIYKCAASYGNTSLSVGNIKNGLDTRIGGIYDQFINRDKKILDSGQCHGCAALPICMGGCAFKSLREKGVMHKSICRHDQKECFENFVRQYFNWHVTKKDSSLP